MGRLGVRGAFVEGRYVAGDISVTEGVVDQIGLPPGSSGVAIPGFVDLQVNGFGGVDFTTASGEEWAQANASLARTGVAAYVANLISNDVTVINRALSVAREVRAIQGGESAEFLGVHLEGPFLSPQKSGIHSPDFLQNPTIELMRTWREAGPVLMTTLAPELSGALPMIESLVSEGVVVSLGHSNATADEAGAGFEAGATTVTHIFNGMSGITARDPGLAGVALSRDDIWLQLILDFLHVDRTLAQLILKFAPQRVVLVTDCLPITGTPGTHFTLGGTDIELREGRAVNSAGVLAGSVVTMDQALRNALACGMSEVDAVNATSLNPRRLLDPQYEGPLLPGTAADLVVLDDSWEIVDVLVRGQSVLIQEVV